MSAQNTETPQRRHYRRQPRWPGDQMALAQIGDQKYLGRTGDLSLQGVRLNLLKAVPETDQEIRVAVVFDDDLVGLDGRVVYAHPTPWGSVVGVHCPELPPRAVAAITSRGACRLADRPI